MSHGWNDPVAGTIKIAYRRKGVRREHEFSGEVFLLNVPRMLEDEKTYMKRVPRAELPLRENVLDLSKFSVVGFGGKRKQQIARMRNFLKENSTFSGALLLYPGSGNWDLGEGFLFFTSEELLQTL
jgi:hypothetical protein